MRHKIFAFTIMLCVCISCLGATKSIFEMPVSTVILDPGHGGSDPGAISNFNGGLLEKDVVLDIALAVKDKLHIKAPDVTVVMTRDDDTFIDLAQRAAVASQWDPGIRKQTIFISIHTNSVTMESVSGFEILIKKSSKQVQFFSTEMQPWKLLRYASESNSQLNEHLNNANERLAASIEQAVTTTFPDMRNRGVKPQNVWVLNASTVPSVLIETSFISNEQDAVALSDPQWIDRMADAICEGILNYIHSLD